MSEGGSVSVFWTFDETSTPDDQALSEAHPYAEVPVPDVHRYDWVFLDEVQDLNGGVRGWLTL
jgi:hypothetical protein